MELGDRGWEHQYSIIVDVDPVRSVKLGERRQKTMLV